MLCFVLQKKHAKCFAQFGASKNKDGDYDQAIASFTSAIDLCSTNFRFYSGRSFSYERKLNYKKALEDAETCLTLKPGEKKGLFRKGKALMGLKDYSTADKIFREVLKIDETYSDASEEIVNGRLLRLMEMGFDMAKSQKILDESKITEDFEIVLDELLGPKEIDEPVENSVMIFSPTTATPHTAEANSEPPPENEFPTQTKGFTKTPAAPKFAEKTSNSTSETQLWKDEIAQYQNQVDIQTQNRKITNNDFQYDLNGKPINGESNSCPEIKAPSSMWSNPVSGPRRVPAATATKTKNPPPQQRQQPARQQHNPLVLRNLPKYENECFYWMTSGCWKSDAECQFLHIPERRGVDGKKTGLKRPKFSGYR